KLSFFGRYSALYFSDESRAQFTKTASALADALHAENAAVYARCEADQSHFLGSWFQGKDPGGAAASVVYFMGGFAPVPHLRPELLGGATPGGIDRPEALANVGRSTAGIGYDALRALVGAQGGSIAGKPGSPCFVTFSFRDGNQA